MTNVEATRQPHGEGYTTSPTNYVTTMVLLATTRVNPILSDSTGHSISETHNTRNSKHKEKTVKPKIPVNRVKVEKQTTRNFNTVTGYELTPPVSNLAGVSRDPTTVGFFVPLGLWLVAVETHVTLV